jgi:hypothetical protein
MEAAYDYFNLDDFDQVSRNLPSMRLDYIRWNVDFASSNLETC